MKEHCLGNYPAAIKLSKILEEENDKKLQKRIGNMWNDYCLGLKNLKHIKEKNYKHRLSLHWRNEFIEKINQYKFKEVIKTHFTCIIHTKFKELNRQHDN